MARPVSTRASLLKASFEHRISLMIAEGWDLVGRVGGGFFLYTPTGNYPKGSGGIFTTRRKAWLFAEKVVFGKNL